MKVFFFHNSTGAFSHVNGLPSQNKNVYHMVVQCSQTFANIKHIITVFHEHVLDVCEDSSKCVWFWLGNRNLSLIHNPLLLNSNGSTSKQPSGDLNLQNIFEYKYREHFERLLLIVQSSVATV